MAPSTDQFLLYIYGKGSAATLTLLLVHAALVSAILLLACAFCKKYRTKEENLMKNRWKLPKFELKKFDMDNGIIETNGIENGAITTGTEQNNMRVTVKLKNDAVLGFVKREPEKSPPLLHRVLPLPPENLQDPPAAEKEDHLYDCVKDMKEQVAETRRHNATSNQKVTMSISKTLNTTALENQEPLKLEQINTLYVSADEVKDSPFHWETTSDCPSHEANEMDEDGKTRVVNEPLYALVRKGASVKKPPEGDKSKVKDSALRKVVLPEKLDGVYQTVHFVTSMEEKTPYPQSPAEKVDAMLTYWKKIGLESQLSNEGMTINVGQEAPPLVPVKRFDLESEIEQHTIEKEIA